MYFNQYQLAAKETAMYDDPLYPIASLMVESAELSDLFIKPWLRGDYTEIDRSEVISEAGDVLWNLACLLADQDITLSEVAQYNLQKLKDRADRGVIQGSGGNRWIIFNPGLHGRHLIGHQGCLSKYLRDTKRL